MRNTISTTSAHTLPIPVRKPTRTGERVLPSLAIEKLNTIGMEMKGMVSSIPPLS